MCFVKEKTIQSLVVKKNWLVCAHCSMRIIEASYLDGYNAPNMDYRFEISEFPIHLERIHNGELIYICSGCESNLQASLEGPFLSIPNHLLYFI